MTIATKEDFKVDAVLTCRAEGIEFTITKKYDDGMWEAKTARGEVVLFEVEASCYTVK